MIHTVYNYEGYQPYNVSVTPLVGTTKYDIESSISPCYYGRRDKNILIPIPKGISVVPVDGMWEDGNIRLDTIIKPSQKTLSFGDSLYIHPNCNIPRIKLSQNYKRTLSSFKSDFCVVPKYDNTKIEVTKTALFLNKLKGKIYVVKTFNEWTRNGLQKTTPDFCKNYNPGTTPIDINPILKGSTIKERHYYNDKNSCTQSNWEDFLESSLVFYGYACELSTKWTWLADYFDGKLSNVVSENSVMSTLGSEENKITKEVCDNIREMLNSTDETVVGLGLKSLAELDYQKYRNSVIYLLCNVSHRWKNNDMKNSTSVKYMINYLDLGRYISERYTKDISFEDFNLLKEVVGKSFDEGLHSYVEQMSRKFPFAKFLFNYSVDFIPTLDGDDQNIEAE